MITKLRNMIAVLTGVALLTPAIAAAHVVVTPDQAGVASRQTFNISVPNEKEVEVTELKIVLPSGLDDVTPTVKPGWQINADKTTITWSGGTIPAGQRDDFTFRAQVPAKAGQLVWKAYQTYSDGTTVSWDQKPTGGDDDSGANGPYSVTKVVDDLAAPAPAEKTSSHDTLALSLAVAALVLAVAALQRSGRKQ